MGEITILVIEDHPLFRQGVVDALSLDPDIVVVAQAADGRTGLGLIHQLAPDVAIIDVNLPGLNGQQVASQVVAEKLKTRIVFLTGYDDAEQHLQAARVGASAYCTKDMEPDILINVIKRVARGEMWVDDYANILEAPAEEYAYHYSDLVNPSQPLSAREMQVLIQVTSGQSNKEIARTLSISHQTVKNHVTAILRKLGVDDRTQAAIYALRRGWVRLVEDEKTV